MRETLAALVIFAILAFLAVTCVDIANGKTLLDTEKDNKRGPTYVIPRMQKSRHIVRIICKWGDGKLTCGPAIGTKWYKEWK